MARLYSNENFPMPVVLELQRFGHDVLTSNEAGRANQRISDHQVLAEAIKDNRAVLTLNRRDFIKLHERSTQHTGIVVCTVDADYAGLAARIDSQIAKHGSLAGQLVRVNRLG